MKSIEVINSSFYPKIPRYCPIRRVENLGCLVWDSAGGSFPGPELGSPNRLLSLPSHLGGPSPGRTAHDYQREPDYEQRSEGRVVEQIVDCQQRGSYDEEETGDGGELAERSHKDSGSISDCE